MYGPDIVAKLGMHFSFSSFKCFCPCVLFDLKRVQQMKCDTCENIAASAAAEAASNHIYREEVTALPCEVDLLVSQSRRLKVRLKRYALEIL
jgi:hypothetical protein